MNFSKILSKLGWPSSIMSKLGAIALFGMMCLTTVDVIGRYLFNTPLLGAFELTEFMVLILIFSFLAFTQANNGHVSVELLLNKFPRKIQQVIYLFNHIVCFIFMILITWMGLEKAFELIATGENSTNLSLPNYPFAFFMALGCAVMCIEYFRNILQILGHKDKDFRL